ncbi:MAG TPA: bifunctional nuclease family protein [Thermodesulfobacteriota bacterium]
MLRIMKVSGLTIDPFTSVPIIILKDVEDRNALPIWIGLLEASSIATELEKITLARPMTHDLVKNIFEQLDIQVERVEVTDLRENTFYATIHLQSRGRSYVVDSRPSDAIAIALRTNAPIYVDDRVLEKSRRADVAKRSAEPADRSAEARKWADILDNLTLEDLGGSRP